MAKPNYQDATLMLQLAQQGAALGQNEAMNWMWSDQFVPDYAEFVKKYPRGSEGFASASKIYGVFETIGTLINNKLIKNRDTSYFLDKRVTIRCRDRVSPIVEVGGHRYESSLFSFRRDYQ